MKPGDIYVAKSPRELGFLSPCLSSYKIDRTLLSYMIMTPLTLEGWHELFDQINSCFEANNDGTESDISKIHVVTQKELQDFQEEEKQAKTYKTPRKRNATSSSTWDMEQSFYKWRCSSGTNPFDALNDEKRLNELMSVVVDLDLAMDSVQTLLKTLVSKFDKCQDKNNEVEKLLEAKI